MKRWMADWLASVPMWIWVCYPRRLKVWLFFNADLNVILGSGGEDDR